MALKTIIFSFFIISLFTSCVEEFETPSFEFERILVVDGGITDERKTHEIRLSYTFPLEEGITMDNVRGATMFITNSQGAITNFSETEEGVYSSPSDFRGIAGEEYQLFFSTPDGNSYQSNPSALISSPPIDSIYGRFESVIVDQNNSFEAGIQFFVDTHDPSGNAQFFRYEWDETYLNITPFESIFILDDNDRVVTRTSLGVEQVRTCYISDNSNEVIIANSLSNELNRISAFPIRFANTIDRDILRDRYSILVRQFSLNRENHDFYQSLRDINVSGGSLFDQQVGNINGNIFSVNNAQEPVLGYFEVAGAAQLRMFFDSDDFQSPFERPSFRNNCRRNVLDTLVTGEIPDAFIRNGRLRIISPTTPSQSEWLIAPASCSDCTTYASNERPDFWVD